MEEEEDKDDKKDKMEGQHTAAEEGKQKGVSASRDQSETCKDTDNKTEVFQMSSEVQVLETRAQNDIQENVRQKNDAAPNIGESSVNTGPVPPARVVRKRKPVNATFNDEHDYVNIEMLNISKSDRNASIQLQKPQDPQEKLPSESAKHHGQIKEKDKNVDTKTELKHHSTTTKQLQQAEDAGRKTATLEKKREGSQPVNQSHFNKGQKSFQTPRLTGKEIQQREEKDKMYTKLQARKQDLQGTSAASKTQQKKGPSEQTKSQLDQKLKTEEKQTGQSKEGKKQPLFQKEQRIAPKQAETRKIDKREQKSPAAQKQLPNLPPKKSPVHRKEQILPSPKKRAPSQTPTKDKQSNLQKKKQMGTNVNAVKNNETKGVGQLQATEDYSLSAQNQQNPPDAHSSIKPQEASGKIVPKESTGPLIKSEKEDGKHCKYEEKVMQKGKQEEDQAKGTNKLTEKKSQQEKQNEIKKHRQQNYACQQPKQFKKENLQSVEEGKKMPQKSKAPVPHKEEEITVPLVKNKQASKELRKVQKQSIQNKTVKKDSVSKEKPSEDIIHSIRRQYEQLCKEEALQQHQPEQKEEKVQQQQKPQANNDKNKIETNDQLAQKKSQEYEEDKGPGCGGMQGKTCPIYFGVKSYLHHFYDTTPIKNPRLDEEYAEEDDFEYTVDPIKRRGCRKCCQGFWFRAGLWGGINLILVGVITFLVGYLTPQREMVVGQQGDLEILDRSAIIFNHRLELCRLAGLAVFCCGGMVLFIVLFISTLIHVKGRNNNESTCCAEGIYYGYAASPLIEPFIVAQTQDVTTPSTAGIKIPIIEQIKSVQPSIWPEMGTVTEGSRVGQMP